MKYLKKIQFYTQCLLITTGFLAVLWAQPADSLKNQNGLSQSKQVSGKPAVAQKDTAGSIIPKENTVQDTSKTKPEPVAIKKVNKDSIPRGALTEAPVDTSIKRPSPSDSGKVIQEAKTDSTQTDSTDTWNNALQQSPDSLRDSTQNLDSVKATLQPVPKEIKPVQGPLEGEKDEYGVRGKKQENVFRQSRINTIDDMKGKYKSPKKAMFMSLLLPGLGQAYVGSYIRSGLYVIAEGSLIFGWRHYVVTKHDRQVRKYRKYAAEHWKFTDHENTMNDLSLRDSDFANSEELLNLLPTRDQYCNSIFNIDSDIGSRSQTCRDIPYDEDLSNNYQSLSFYTFLTGSEKDENGSPISDEDIIKWRQENLIDEHTFYELIGKHDEYLGGWDDVEDFDIVTQDNNENTVSVFITGSSDNRSEYRSMRAKATEYSRMQSVFLGFMVLNHLVSALDAAITAKYHNKKLYETEVKWHDRIKLKSYLAYRNNLPEPGVVAYLPF